MVDRAWLARLLPKVRGDSTLLRTSRELCDVDADDLTRDLVRIASRGAQPTEEMCKAQRVRDTKFYKSRLVPLGPDIKQLIQEYLHQPGRRNQHYRSLFQTKSASAIAAQVADTSFSRLREIARIERRDDSYFQPRLHDLRHTFAVHRLTEWYRQNADVPRLLPALSTYLGHVSLSATQRYLTMTPELLEQANRRFERYACGGAR
jgi:integrase/recombinase XerD